MSITSNEQKTRGSGFGKPKKGAIEKPKGSLSKPNLFDLDREMALQDCSVTVMSGSSSKAFPLANQSVGGVRQLLRKILNIADNAASLINGKQAEEDQVLKAGDQLEFIRRAGSKGVFGTMIDS